MPNSKNDLIQFFDQADFVQKTIDQINKDLSGLTVLKINDVNPEKGSPIEEISKQLVNVLQDLTHYSGEHLMQFLYQVDLPEKEMEAILNQGYDHEKLCFNIVRREAQKVFLRWHYR